MIKENSRYRLQHCRKIKKEDRIRYFLKAYGNWIEVDESVFKMYDSSYAHELYLNKLDGIYGTVSLDGLIGHYCETEESNDILLDVSTEDICLEKLQREWLLGFNRYLEDAIELLNEAEKDMISSIFYKNCSLREYAEAKTIPLTTVHRRLNKALVKLQNKLIDARYITKKEARSSNE